MRYRPLRWHGSRQPAGATELRREVRRWLATQAFTPRCDAWLSGFSGEFSVALGERGWIGMTWPTEYGGRNRSALERYVVQEELLAAGAPVAAHWIADRQTGPLLLKLGTNEQKRQFLPEIAAGRCYFSIGMSEPDSGSDLASIRTSAKHVDGGWIVNGTKLWTSGAHHSQFLLALVRTSPAERHAGMSQLIIELSAPGVTVRPIRVLTGEHHFNEVVLRDVFVHDTMLVGSEGDGWRQVLNELAYERSGPERLLSTYPLLAALAASNSDDRRDESLGRLAAHLSALRSLSIRVADALDAGEQPTIEAAAVKDLGTRFETRVTEIARAIGPRSNVAFERMLHEALLAGPGFTLRGGTSEILRGVVARGLVSEGAS